MCIMRMDRLSMVEAESFIAALWRALEEHGIPTPQLRICQAREALDLSIEFLSEEDSDLVRRVISRLRAETASTSNRLSQPAHSDRGSVQILPFARHRRETGDK